MRIIAVINQKGGVGKTTTTVNLGHALALSGNRVILIDLDPQSQLSVSLGCIPPPKVGMDAVLLDAKAIAEPLMEVRDGLELIAAGPRLTEVEALTEGGGRRGHLLSDALRGLPAGRDYLLLDCPSSGALLTLNALLACDEILIPVAGDFLALQGLSTLLRALGRASTTAAREFPFWIALTRCFPRRRLAREVTEKLLQHFPYQLLATPIRETAALAESPGAGKTIFEYRRGSNSAQDYRHLADDLIGGVVMSSLELRSA